MKKLAGRIINRVKRSLRHIVEQKDTPESIALGLAVGIFVALTPTMGVQMIIGAMIATLCRANRIAAIAAVYLTNPVTAGPVYGFTYWVGLKVLGWNGRWDLFRAVLEVEGWMNKFFAMVAWTSRDIMLPLWVGGGIVGLLAALIVYPVALRLIKGHRVVQAQKRRDKLQRERELIQEELAGDEDLPEA